MFVQTSCFSLGGTIEYCTSADGHRFRRAATSLASVPGSPEAGIYDPHPALLSTAEGTQKHLVYSAMPRVGHADIYLARSLSGTWEGPWERLGPILRHEDIAAHHNQHDEPGYEWGLEGAQLVQLPAGILLVAVCFLPNEPPGRKQRVFFAIAASPAGQYKVLGPAIDPPQEGWDSAENGHASVLVKDEALHLFYQARSLTGPWGYARKEFPLRAFVPQPLNVQ